MIAATRMHLSRTQHINPKRNARRTQPRTSPAIAETHPETFLGDDAPPDSRLLERIGV
jgi:hypothetical protein